MRIDALALRLRPRTAWEVNRPGRAARQHAWRSVVPCAAAGDCCRWCSWRSRWPRWRRGGRRSSSGGRSRGWIARCCSPCPARRSGSARRRPTSGAPGGTSGSSHAVARADDYGAFRPGGRSRSRCTSSKAQASGRPARAWQSSRNTGQGIAALVLQVFLACESALCVVYPLAAVYWFAPQGSAPDLSTLTGR